MLEKRQASIRPETEIPPVCNWCGESGKKYLKRCFAYLHCYNCGVTFRIGSTVLSKHYQVVLADFLAARLAKAKVEERRAARVLARSERKHKFGKRRKRKAEIDENLIPTAVCIDSRSTARFNAKRSKRASNVQPG